MFKLVNKLWRVFATGLSFTLFGIGGLILALLVFPVQQLMIRDGHKRQVIARQTVHYTFKFFVGFMAFVGVATFAVKQQEAFKQLRGQLILANHPSLIDVVVLISVIPNADCVVKAHLLRNPFMRGVIKSTGYISNADSDGVIKDCQASLANGNNLIIFPEGTRTNPGAKPKFQRGAANIALRCEIQPTCVAIDIQPPTLTKSEKWYHVPERRFDVVVALKTNVPSIEELPSESMSKSARVFTRDLEQFFLEEVQ
ncbi:lysophospholipid acyltransferase family protein [Thalassotalea fusca]